MKRNKFGLVRSLPCRILGLGMGLMVTLPALASGGGNTGAAEGINYIAIEPALVVNYGGPGKARYIKAELSIRSENAADANTVTHHLPLIRDRLVSLLSAQTDETVNSSEGKEYLRVYALAEINKALLQVQGLTPAPVTEPAPAAQVPPTSAAAVATPANLPTGNLPTVTPVAGPASDLYFNNFVVQK